MQLRLIASLVLILTLAAHARQTVSAQASQQFAEAQTLLQQNRLAEAEVALTQAHSLAPGDAAILTLLARVKARLGDPAQAIVFFAQVAQLTPNSAGAHLDLAIALSDAGDLGQALDETARAIQIAPGNALAHLNRARILADLNRRDEAAAEFAIALRRDPAYPDTCYYWALLERERNQLPHESELLERTVKLQPGNAKAWFLLGRSLTDQGRSAEAIAPLRRAIELNPHAESAFYMLARALQTRDPSESRRLMAQFNAVRQQDASLEAAKRLGDQGNEASGNQQWAEAIRLYRQALSTCDTCEIAAALHKNLGLALCRSGDIASGRAELEQAMQLDPNDPGTVKALAVLKQ